MHAVFGLGVAAALTTVHVAVPRQLLAATSMSDPVPSLSGTWQAEWLASGDVPVRIFLALKQEGTAVTGSVEMTWGTEPVHQGRCDGDHFSLRLGPETVPIRIEGTVHGGELRFTLAEPRQPTKQLTATRVAVMPAAAAKQLLPAPRPLAPLVALSAPLMGWSSWNAYNESVSEADIRDTARTLERTGLRDAGYRYINIDEGWIGQRDAEGKLRANRKFPDMRTLGDWLHARGFLLGLYSSPGPTTCGGYPGSFGHEVTDAAQFAAWGADYLKYDWCSAGKTYTTAEMPQVYQQMGEALQRTHRPFAYELCQYGLESVERWAPQTGATLWRTTEDIASSWSSVHKNAQLNEGRRAVRARTASTTRTRSKSATGGSRWKSLAVNSPCGRSRRRHSSLLRICAG